MDYPDCRPARPGGRFDMLRDMQARDFLIDPSALGWGSREVPPAGPPLAFVDLQACPAELRVAETTVKTHLGHALDKLGLATRVAAVVFGYESGIVRPGGG